MASGSQSSRVGSHGDDQRVHIDPAVRSTGAGELRRGGDGRGLQGPRRDHSSGQPAPPFHVHPHTDEAFYVAGGEGTFLLGDREVRVTAGGFVFIPRRMPHTAWNSGDDPMLGLIIISPGGAEHVFEPAEGG